MVECGSFRLSRQAGGLSWFIQQSALRVCMCLCPKWDGGSTTLCSQDAHAAGLSGGAGAASLLLAASPARLCCAECGMASRHHRPGWHHRCETLSLCRLVTCTGLLICALVLQDCVTHSMTWCFLGASRQCRAGIGQHLVPCSRPVVAGCLLQTMHCSSPETCTCRRSHTSSGWAAQQALMTARWYWGPAGGGAGWHFQLSSLHVLAACGCPGSNRSGHAIKQKRHRPLVAKLCSCLAIAGIPCTCARQQVGKCTRSWPCLQDAGFRVCTGWLAAGVGAAADRLVGHRTQLETD